MKRAISNLYILIIILLVACNSQPVTKNVVTISSPTFTTPLPQFSPTAPTFLDKSYIPTQISEFIQSNLNCVGLKDVINTLPVTGNPPLPGRRGIDGLISPDLKWINNFYEPKIVLTSMSNSQIRVTNPSDARIGINQYFSSWSPDSSAIAVTANSDNSRMNELTLTQLIIDRFSNDKKQLTPFIFDLPGTESHDFPVTAWSPDSQKLALLTGGGYSSGNTLFILDNHARLERAIQLPRRTQYLDGYFAYIIDDPSFWENGDLLYIAKVADQGKPNSFELRQTNLYNLDTDKLIFKGDWSLSVFGVNDQYLLIGNYINNWDFDLLLLDRIDFQVIQKFHFQAENMGVIIHDAVPNSPYLLFSVEGQVDNHFYEELWMFAWDTLLLQRIDFNHPWLEALSWRPVVDSLGFFTVDDDQCEFWIHRP